MILRGAKGSGELPSVGSAAVLGGVAGVGVLVALVGVFGGASPFVDVLWPAALFGSLGSLLGGGLALVARRAPDSFPRSRETHALRAGEESGQ